MLLRQNQTWIGIGYCVRTNDTNGALWYPQTRAAGQDGRRHPLPLLGNLLTQRPSVQNGLAQDPSQLYAATSRNACQPGSANTSPTGSATASFTSTSGPLPPTASRCSATASTPTRVSAPIRSPRLQPVRQTWRSQPRVPDNWPASTSAATPLPAAVEMELGLLEQHAWERYNSIGSAAARLAYLQREDISSRVHLFRQRIPIRNVDPLAYQ